MNEDRWAEEAAFAERVKVAVRRSGKTHDQIAAEMGMTRSAVGNWLAGLRKPRLMDVPVLAKVLGVDPAELAWGVAPQQSLAMVPSRTLLEELEARLSA